MVANRLEEKPTHVAELYELARQKKALLAFPIKEENNRITIDHSDEEEKVIPVTVIPETFQLLQSIAFNGDSDSIAAFKKIINEVGIEVMDQLSQSNDVPLALLLLIRNTDIETDFLNADDNSIRELVCHLLESVK